MGDRPWTCTNHRTNPAPTICTNRTNRKLKGPEMLHKPCTAVHCTGPIYYVYGRRGPLGRHARLLKIGMMAKCPPFAQATSLGFYFMRAADIQSASMVL